MVVRKEDFPVVVQAFDTSGAADVFIAEQVVSSQAEIDTFTSRYTGKLIKARKLTDAEHSRLSGNNVNTTKHTRKSGSSTFIWIILLLIIIALVVIGYTSGWFQQMMNG